MLSHLVELREVLLTSRLELEMFGADPASALVRVRLALGLRRLGRRLAQLGRTERLGERAWPSDDTKLELPDLLSATALFEPDAAQRRLLPTLARRLTYLGEEVEAMRKLVLEPGAHAPTSTEDSAAPGLEEEDRWPLRVLLDGLSFQSPVLRHALRSALAFVIVHLSSPALPWATRSYWLLLSVAVVLRGTLDDTLSRRNARIAGTLLGCLLATFLVLLLPSAWLKAVFVMAVGIAHALVNVRYLLTATCGTVMALLQAHLSTPLLTPLALERLLDTVVGALFAWAFSYVLPSWERRSLPAVIGRAFDALNAYAQAVLTLTAVSESERSFARQRAHDQLAALAAALRRSAAEPRRVRPPTHELLRALDHAQRLMAHLSSLRLLLGRADRIAVSEVLAALTRSRCVVGQCLALTSAADDVQAGPFDRDGVPLAPVEVDPLAWVLRRLDACVYDANVAGSSARRALELLAVAPEPRHWHAFGFGSRHD